MYPLDLLKPLSVNVQRKVLPLKTLVFQVTETPTSHELAQVLKNEDITITSNTKCYSQSTRFHVSRTFSIILIISEGYWIIVFYFKNMFKYALFSEQLKLKNFLFQNPPRIPVRTNKFSS